MATNEMRMTLHHQHRHYISHESVHCPLATSDAGAWDCKTIAKRWHYSPPWADLSIIGVAGSSGSGKSTLAKAIVDKLDLPWVIIMSMDSFYKSLDAEASRKAFRNEWNFDSPESIDFDLLVQVLRDLKAGKRAEVPMYSFEKHQRIDGHTTVYSPHVLVLEGIFALHDSRVRDMLDMKIYCQADLDTCLARRIKRDVAERGRDLEGILKQWFAWVKPNFEHYVDPQHKQADIIVPCTSPTSTSVAMSMVVMFIEHKLLEKSSRHRAALTRLSIGDDKEPLSDRVIVLSPSPQLRGMSTIISDIDTSREDFAFYFNRLAALLVEKALDTVPFAEKTVSTPAGQDYQGLQPAGEISAVMMERGGKALETGLRRVLPDCRTGLMLIQNSMRTGEPELHLCRLAGSMTEHASVLLLDAQMSSGGSALMAVQVLCDHGVRQNRIVFVTYSAGRRGLHRLVKVFPEMTVVLSNLTDDSEERWVEQRYFGC